jgi:two-component system, LytTR family, response regulator
MQVPETDSPDVFLKKFMQTTIVSATPQPLSLSICHGVEVICIRDIVRIQASSSYSSIFFVNGKKLVVAKVLGWFEGQLSSCNFIRIHRTHLVNKSYIRQYLHTGKIKLHSGEYLDVSRRKRHLITGGWQGSGAGQL